MSCHVVSNESRNAQVLRLCYGLLWRIAAEPQDDIRESVLEMARYAELQDHISELAFKMALSATVTNFGRRITRYVSRAPGKPSIRGQLL
jgi:hypothetical protein